MADLSYPTSLLPLPGIVQGREPGRHTAVTLLSLPGSPISDIRNFRPPTGVISDQVVVKVGATETPYANGRVWLLRLADGWKAWEGWSDATGHYTATGLELGAEYVAVAIDPTRTHKTTGAGPVVATLPPAP